MTEAGTGRPSEFTEAMAAFICERIAEGETLRSLAREVDGFPSRVTVYRWLEANESFRNQYARATELRAHLWGEEILEAADDGSNDWMEKRHPETGEVTGWQLNGEHVQRSKLRVEARKWLMGKAAPRIYGEKTTTALVGPDGGPVEVASVEITDEQRARAMMALLARQQAEARAAPPVEEHFDEPRGGF